MIIPEVLKKTVLSIFGEKGSKWLVDFPAIFEECAEKWKLAYIVPSEHMSINYVCFAQSKLYGDVVLKAGVPHREFYTEVKALDIYDGRNICKCYDHDAKLGAMLLERVRPGKQLTAISDYAKRYEIAANIISKLPVSADDVDGFPTFTDWIERAFKRARSENIVGEKLLSYIDTAEKHYKELESSSRSRVLLHGDLHHENILLDQSDCWKAIDPKGVIGVPCLEGGRFMINQLSMIDKGDKASCIEKMTAVIGSALGESKKTMAVCTLIDMTLSTCWSFEDYIKPDDISDILDSCKLLLNYINNRAM
ncbi:MAG: aminoglycoside phosphotransferase family protein [Bacillota bacterium]